MGPSGFGQLSRGTIYAGCISSAAYFGNDYFNRRNAIILQQNQFTHDAAEANAARAHESAEARTNRLYDQFTRAHESWVANGRPSGSEPIWTEPKK